MRRWTVLGTACLACLGGCTEERGCDSPGDIACGGAALFGLSRELDDPGTYVVEINGDGAAFVCSVEVPSWEDDESCQQPSGDSGAGGAGGSSSSPAAAGSAGESTGVAVASTGTPVSCPAGAGVTAGVVHCGGLSTIGLDFPYEHVELTVSKDGQTMVSEAFDLEYVDAGVNGDCNPCRHASVVVQVPRS